MMLIVLPLPMTTQETHTLSNGRIIGSDHTPFTCGHIFRCIEGKAACPKAANRFSIYASSMRLTGIFDHYQLMSCCKLIQTLHIAGMTIQMYGDHCFCTGSNSSLH